MAYHLPKEPEPCHRCGQLNCDEVPPGYWEWLRGKLARAPMVVEERDFENEPEPFI